MKTLVGIDSGRGYGDGLVLLGNLGFAENEVTLAHIGASIGPQFNPTPLIYAYYDQAELEEASKRAGIALLDEASDVAKSAGLGAVKTVYEAGNSSVALMKIADENRIDLVAIGSGMRSVLERFVLGSVGRALAIGAHQSFLVARGGSNSSRPLKAVFATDHSEYAARCFARLIDMNPQGLGHITVATALESNAYIEVDGDIARPSLTEAENTLESKGAEMVAKIESTGRTAEYRLLEGFPIDAIRKVMAETESDLLILGARGHGLIERVIIGSLALHMVVAEQFSVMVIRIPEPKK